MDEQTVAFKNFVLIVNPSSIRFATRETRENQWFDSGNVEISAAEVEQVIQLMSMAKGFATRQVCPPHITSSPYRIFFEEGDDDTVLKLYKRGGKRENMVPFAFGDIDDLIGFLNKGLLSWQNVQKMANTEVGRPATPAFATPEPTFDGAN